ncbi:MAG: hypothetical protein ACYTBS_21085, partial [Planctomycetota bacterium]
RFEIITNNVITDYPCDICGQPETMDVLVNRIAGFECCRDFVCTRCVETFDPDHHAEFARALDERYKEMYGPDYKEDEGSKDTPL